MPPLLIVVATGLTGQQLLLGDYGRGAPFADSPRGLLAIVALTNQLGYFNILPPDVFLMP